MDCLATEMSIVGLFMVEYPPFGKSGFITSPCERKSPCGAFSAENALSFAVEVVAVLIRKPLRRDDG